MFPGFPAEALTFLRGLARNNDREWFQPRKEIFETKVKAPMLDLVEAINADLAKFAPDYVSEPKKAVFRIYRDTRFSADKSPYKTHIAAVFHRRGGEKGGAPAFYFSISAKEIGIAGGVYDPAPPQLLAIRSWLAENHKTFRAIARRPEKLMGKLHGECLTRVPKGFPADHPAADLIRMKRWVYYATLDAKLAVTPKILTEIVKRFKAAAPVLEELSKALAKPRSRSFAADLLI
ncbi:MAG TPA: DUF2461 domain-containing protein [Bryobacteraceae bacterium]|jgi:uncharacterized protein (TIGR02453 family)|nr:DUF2461 domain-containing protein [Bryobacteraceae bacterium]